MKISSPSFYLKLPAGPSPIRSSGGQHPTSFATRLADEKAMIAMDDGPQVGERIDFSNMTKANYVAWGKAEFAKGTITLDDLFQVQYAGGDFDGSIATDARQHDFVSFFSELIDNEVMANRAADADSIVPAYRHLLAMMAR